MLLNSFSLLIATEDERKGDPFVEKMTRVFSAKIDW